MKKFFTKGRIALLVIFSVLIVDQVIKVVVKTQMYWHQSENVIKWIYEKFGIVDAEPPTWFYIYFTENNGMAFGMEIFGKLFLTLFRIVAVAIIGWFLYKFIKKGLKTGFIVCISLVLTGALAILSIVYSMVCYSMKVPTRSWLHLCLKVVDMLHCFTEKWWICFIFPSLTQHGPNGCRLLVETISFSLALFSILLMQP